jgi:hypothetical protein
MVATVASCAPGGATFGSPTGAGGCDRFGTVDVNGKEYVVQNNEWNSSDTQCVGVKGTAFVVSRANFGLATNGPPASYPAIFKGCHWGNCTSGSGLPAQVASLPAVTSSWTVTVPTTGAFDVAYDVWFNRTPSTSGQPDGTELMIWLNHGGGVQPAGSQVGTVSLAGATWNVWQGPMSGWKYIAYQRTEPTTSVNDLDIRAFIRDAVGRGAIDPSLYLIAIEAGFELWRGGQGFATNSFSAVIGGV